MLLRDAPLLLLAAGPPSDGAVVQRPGEGRSDEPWRWTDEYVAARRAGGLALDLMGHFEDEQTATLLRTALGSDDARIRLFAAGAVLRRGEELDAADVLPVAEAPETRRALYTFLRDAKKASLMPRKLRTQKAMAEADLVRWLASAAGLGHTPDAIELMSSVEHDGSDWHLFRFRSGSPRWADADWMAGVSGPWTVKPTDPASTASR